MPRIAWIWLAASAAALVVLPWYGVESLSTTLAKGDNTLWPALAQPMAGRWWVALAALPLLAAALALLRPAPRLLSWACVAGLLWIVIEGIAVTHKGWGYGLLAGWFGGAPVQPALGWGGLLYALSCLMLLSVGLARQGWLRGDVFVLGAILLVAATVVLFVFVPLLEVLVSAVRDESGALAPGVFLTKLTNRSIWGTTCFTGGTACGAAWNSLLLAVIVGLLTTVLGLAFALVSLRTKFAAPGLLQVMGLLPVITPPFVIGLALILMFGRAGFITDFLARNFDIPRSRWLYGVPGVAIAQVLAFTPIAFMVLQGVLRGVAPSLEEAAQTLRASPLYAFRTVTWPLIRPGVANAFLIGFIESLADFGNPLILGGNFTVLSTDIFFAVVGAAHDQGRAAVLSLVLLVFTLAAFMAQRLWVGDGSYTTVTGKGDSGQPPPLPAWISAICHAVVLPWMALTFAIYGIILAGGFLTQIGRNNTLTWHHFVTVFGFDHGVGGWFMSGSGWDSFITTLELAAVAMPITAGLGLLTAWLLARQSFRGRGTFEFLTMLSFAVPGTVIGISYILAFNVPPVELTGTGTILVICFVFRNMPVGIRAGLASLSQIDRSLDEASLTLRARSFRTLRLVILPIIRPAIVTAMVYSFVRAVTAVSAVIFLTTAQYNLATVYIVGRADIGEYGVALVYSGILIVTMMAALGAIRLFVGQQRIGRREVVVIGA